VRKRTVGTPLYDALIRRPRCQVGLCHALCRVLEGFRFLTTYVNLIAITATLGSGNRYGNREPTTWVKQQSLHAFWLILVKIPSQWLLLFRQERQFHVLIMISLLLITDNNDEGWEDRSDNELEI
jgi:hypothetical protein